MSDYRESIARSASDPAACRPALEAPLDDDAVARRDGYARPLLETYARFDPEPASAIGVPGAAERTRCLAPGWTEERIVAWEDAERTLDRRLPAEEHPALRLDLEAMTAAARWELDVLRLEEALMLPYAHPAQICFDGIRALADEPPAERGARMLHRLRRYAGLTAGTVPLAEEAEAAIRARLDEPGLSGPCRATVERDLAQVGRLVAGIRRLLERHCDAGHEAPPLETLRRQLAGYGAFVRRRVLPQCRDDFRLPAELYAARLRAFGVEMPQAELASRARVALREIRDRLAAAAGRLARQRGWRDDDLAAVLRRVTRPRLAGSEVVAHYRARLRALEQLIAATELVTLPRRRLEIRLASEADAVAMPYPHFRWPRLFGDRRPLGELILPAVAAGDGGDYAGGGAPAASWSVAAHEALPGHALHLDRLLESGAPMPRSVVAWNVACREGWAVYAESEIRPHLPPEARLVALHRDLRRAAAAFLDPGLQQGRLTPGQAREILRTQVGLDEELAAREVWRYTLWRPGQATAYFGGYLQLADLRAEAECRLGATFARRRYHDLVLDQGVLPLSLLRRRVLETCGPAQRRAA